MRASPSDNTARAEKFIAAGLSPEDPMSALGATEIVDAPAQEAGQIRAGRLAGKTMQEAIWILAIPILLQQTMAAGVGFVDKLIAGNLPHEIARSAMDGVGLGSFVGWFIGIAMAGLGVGGQVIIARSMGSGERGEGERALGQSMLLSLAWGVLVALVMGLIAEPLARFSNLSPEGSAACVTYVQTLAWGIPFSGVMMVGAMCLHGAGETHKPFQIAVWVNVVNCIAAWLLSGVTISALGAEIPNPSPTDPYTWGVFGIALGSVISYAFGAWMTIRVLRRGVQDLKLHASALRFDPVMTKRIAIVGIPNFFEGLAMWSVNLFILGIIGEVASRGIGTEAKDGLVGAHIITVQWDAFSFLPGFAMGTAAGALAGQYLGAGNARLAREAIWRCTFIGMAIMVSAGVIFMLFGRALCSVISDDPIHLALVPQCLFASGALQVFFALAMVVRNGLRGVGDTKWILGITVFGCYAIRLPLAWYFGISLSCGLVGIWWALMLEVAVRGMLFLARFRYGAWEKLRV